MAGKIMRYGRVQDDTREGKAVIVEGGTQVHAYA